MRSKANAKVVCTLVGEYVDEAECPTASAFHRGEVVRPQLIANFVYDWEGEASSWEGEASSTVVDNPRDSQSGAAT